MANSDGVWLQGGEKKRSFKCLCRKSAPVVSGVALMLFIAYGVWYLKGWQLSFTNINYTFPPFGSTGVRTMGPLLSDVADNLLPIVNETFHGLNVTAWLSGVGLGAPQGIDLYLSPINYLYLLPSEIAQPVIAVTKVTIAFASMYWFVKELGVARFGAFISGASYGMCSVMIMWNGWPHSTVTMLAPLLFLLLEKLLKKLTIRNFVLIALVAFFMLVAGMATYAAYFFYLTGAYMLFYGLRTYGSQRPTLIRYIVGFVVAVGIGGIISLPGTGSLFDMVGSNGYASSRTSYGTKTLDLANAKTLVFPYLDSSLTVHANEGTLYTGILAVVTLPLTALDFKHKRRASFFLSSVAILLLLIFTHVLDPVFQVLPFVHTSNKFRILVLLNFCLAVLVGINIDNLLNQGEVEGRKRVLIVSLAAVGVAAYFAVLWRVMPTLATATQSGIWQLRIATGLVIVFGLVVVFKLWSSRSIVATVCGVVMSVGVCVDMGYFASQYVPLIERGAAAIPNATDSIHYLQRGTSDGERIVNLGVWNFFPLTNMYYGISNVSGHNFTYTNPDLKTYFEAIDEHVFDISKTRPTFETIQHTNLLSYMGVKYEIGDLDTFHETVSSSESSSQNAQPVPSEPLIGDNALAEEFTATKNDLSAMGVIFGLYAHERTSGSVTMTLSQGDNHVVASDTLQLNDLADNARAYFTFDAISDSAGQSYDLTLSVDDPSGEGIAAYIESTEQAEDSPDQLILAPVYGQLRVGDDGLVIKERQEYAPLITLTDQVEVLGTDAQVLTAMEDSYEPSTVFFSDETGSPQSDSEEFKPLEEGEGITDIDQYDNGTIEFTVDADVDRYVLVNQYYDSEWVGYIDGEQTAVSKGNYLFRAIRVPAGTHHVTLKYEPRQLMMFFGFGACGALLLIALMLARKPLDRMLLGEKPLHYAGE